MYCLPSLEKRNGLPCLITLTGTTTRQYLVSNFAINLFWRLWEKVLRPKNNRDIKQYLAVKWWYFSSDRFFCVRRWRSHRFAKLWNSFYSTLWLGKLNPSYFPFLILLFLVILSEGMQQFKNWVMCLNRNLEVLATEFEKGFLQ